VKQARNRAGAERFAAFLFSTFATAVKEKYGYR
jgi:ABC-type molybdate transport system substrate-binding protein